MNLKVWLLSMLALPLLALACGGEGAAPSPTITKPPELATPAIEEERLLASTFPTIQEVSEAFPGRQWTGGTGQPVTSETQPRAGLVAAWGGGFGAAPSDGRPPEEIQIGLSLYDAADRASATLSDLAHPPVKLDRFDLGAAGDESQGLVTRPSGGPPYTVVLVRVDRTLAQIILPLSDEYGERRVEVTALARTLAQKMEAQGAQ